MPPYTAKRVFRTRPWLSVPLLVLVPATCIGAVVLYRTGGPTLGMAGLAAFAVLGLLALAEVALARIVLGDDAIVVNGILRRTTYRRSDIDSVTWEEGAGVSLKLTDGTWARLPGLGHNAQSLAQTVRGWLRQDGP